MQNLGEKPKPTGCRKLTGREGWRIRVGNYRVIYEIDDARQAGAGETRTATPLNNQNEPHYHLKEVRAICA
ncbi:MAG: hypothetical protein O7A06_15110 [Acidobacteria bacterium]|nr:hypothetical protein [Acidobacteriota bacterium]MCZ6491843.1 hypothetical protein [Acidobacteriota bacterium]MCZ6750408.1 hypothetical protein [Acidobacteriota bacterium]